MISALRNRVEVRLTIMKLQQAIQEMGRVLDLVEASDLDIEMKTLLIRQGVSFLTALIESQLVFA
jgi:hypothetical protein